MATMKRLPPDEVSKIIERWREEDRQKAHAEDTLVACIRCGTEYDEARGDGWCGLCPKCADETEPDQGDTQ